MDKGYQCNIIADSISDAGRRITTFQLRYPRIILAEVDTHREFSRNSASSRAVPITKMIDRVIIDPFMPVYWGRNQKGMQASEEVDELSQVVCNQIWLGAKSDMVKRVRMLQEQDVHKQLSNRLLETFMYTETVVTSTTWANFLHQRTHPAAMPEFRKIAEMMADDLVEQIPNTVRTREWHLPYIQNIDWTMAEEYCKTTGQEILGIIRAMSVARCCRVSYFNQEGVRSIEDDMDLFNRLIHADPMHASPLEHVAMALSDKNEQSGNFRGWLQYRKLFAKERVGRFIWKGVEIE